MRAAVASLLCVVKETPPIAAIPLSLAPRGCRIQSGLILREDPNHARVAMNFEWIRISLSFLWAIYSHYNFQWNTTGAPHPPWRMYCRDLACGGGDMSVGDGYVVDFS
jgi:hypothetical protein